MIEKALIRNCVLAERDFGIKSNEYTNAKNALSEYIQKEFREYEKYLVDNMTIDIKENLGILSNKELCSLHSKILRQKYENNIKLGSDN